MLSTGVCWYTTVLTPIQIIREGKMMKLRELITQLHQLQAQIKLDESKAGGLTTQIESLEIEIRSRLDASDKAFDELSEQEFQSLMADLGDSKQLTVEVVYATKFEQCIQEVQLSLGSSLEDCILMSGILDKCPDIDLTINKVGIHGMVKPLTELVSDADRIEIYRPVTAEA